MPMQTVPLPPYIHPYSRLAYQIAAGHVLVREDRLVWRGSDDPPEPVQVELGEDHPQHSKLLRDPILDEWLAAPGPYDSTILSAGS